MSSELQKRIRKTGQPPGTPIYTGDKTNIKTRISVINYTEQDFHEVTGASLNECLPSPPKSGVTWVNVEGLNDASVVTDLAARYHLHPLTVEDILNVGQRPRVEEFEGYYFITLKILFWDEVSHTFTSEQSSIIFGKDFVLSFQEHENNIFNALLERLRSATNQRLRQQGSDYLAYRLLDTIVDQYFVVLEAISDQIEKVEGLIIAAPTPQNARMLYHIKRKVLLLRKAIWPMREAIGHLLQDEEKLITSFTHVYLRDVYDHAVQAIDTIETFRDMMASILDVYLSSLTTRMNEVMKVLTIIATIFIPITFIASIYGMNFHYMPELQWRWAYPAVLGIMAVIAILMLIYFRRKKWI